MPTLNLARERITITIKPALNLFLKRTSEKTGLSKSATIEKALEELVKHRLKEDTKALSKITFADLPSEDDWLSL